MAKGRGVHGCLDSGLKCERQGSGLGAQKKPGQEAWMGESAWASLGSLSKYGRFFGLHLSHPGHGPRDLLSRYCRQNCASPVGPSSSLSRPSQHLPKLQSQTSPPAGSSTPLSSAPASNESSWVQQIQETHIPSAARNWPVSARQSVAHYYLPSNCCVLVPGSGTTAVNPVEASCHILSSP